MSINDTSNRSVNIKLICLCEKRRKRSSIVATQVSESKVINTATTKRCDTEKRYNSTLNSARRNGIRMNLPRNSFNS